MALLNNPKIDLKQLDDEENTSLLFSVKEKKGQFAQAILKKLENADPKSEIDEL